jgi:hypothetical protein
VTELVSVRALAREYYEAARTLSAVARDINLSSDRERMLAVAAWYGAEGARLESRVPAHQETAFP